MDEQERSVIFAENERIVSSYIETAKVFINLSTGALALTVTFREKILGAAAGLGIGGELMASWLFYLFAIGFGGFYQYYGVKYIDSFSLSPGEPGTFKYFEKNPGVMYGAMLWAFLIASTLLIFAAWDALQCMPTKQ